MHHSQYTGNIIGYSHSYCNFKVRENREKISVNTHNLFRFDFFLLLKGMKTDSQRTRDISIGFKDPTDTNFANIGNQVAFIDTIKHFLQSLGTLAGIMTDEERLTVKKCKMFILRDEVLSKKFNACTDEDQEWVFKYLSTGKSIIPCDMITRFDSLDISPEEGSFFCLTNFTLV